MTRGDQRQSAQSDPANIDYRLDRVETDISRLAQTVNRLAQVLEQWQGSNGKVSWSMIWTVIGTVLTAVGVSTTIIVILGQMAIAPISGKLDSEIESTKDRFEVMERRDEYQDMIYLDRLKSEKSSREAEDQWLRDEIMRLNEELNRQIGRDEADRDFRIR